MKLANELYFVVEQFKKIPNIEGYAAWLKKNGKYEDFETRLAWDCMHCAVGSKIMCEWYEKYGCNDAHIDTLAKKALAIVRNEKNNKEFYADLLMEQQEQM